MRDGHLNKCKDCTKTGVHNRWVEKSKDPEWVEKEKDIPLKRLGKVEEIAAAALLLASDDGHFFCGQFVSPNGGAVFF